MTGAAVTVALRHGLVARVLSHADVIDRPPEPVDADTRRRRRRVLAAARSRRRWTESSTACKGGRAS